MHIRVTRLRHAEIMATRARQDSAGALTIREVAGVLGCSSATVRRLIRSGRLPALRLGEPPHGRFRVSREDLADFARRPVADA
jgi:excisionase family DNA binding protein